MNNVLDEIKILINNGIYDKALDRLLKIHNINNTNVDINFELAKVYFALKDDGKGLNILKNILTNLHSFGKINKSPRDGGVIFEN